MIYVFTDLKRMVTSNVSSATITVIEKKQRSRIWFLFCRSTGYLKQCKFALLGIALICVALQDLLGFSFPQFVATPSSRDRFARDRASFHIGMPSRRRAS